MIKPPDFDPAQAYPVYQFTYGGPHAQQVQNAWGGCSTMYHQLLAQTGHHRLDLRQPDGERQGRRVRRGRVSGVSARSSCATSRTASRWLKQQPYVDGTRIGIHGWSYGGFMTSYALTHSTSFAMGIAGGTVTDWRNYDTVYTERYHGTAAGQPRRLSRAARRASPPQSARAAAADPRRHRRQRARRRTRCSSSTSCRRRRSRSS